ncbi:MAG TPA: heme-copper oxidase subunit III [Polyangia bacterium]|nr:heme-copper oxidase subunit III [Polyangia bacterium]
MSEIAATATSDAAERPAPDGETVGTTGMWTFLATDAMGFGGLFIAYGILRVRADVWPDPRSHLALVPAAAMTFALLASSLTMTLATRAASARVRRAWLDATLALGVAFLAGGAVEYHHLLAGGGAMGLTNDLFASTFYLLTGFHGLHVLAGVVGIAFMFRAKSRPQSLETMALYWHFVDAMWMPIFSIIYLWPGR